MGCLTALITQNVREKIKPLNIIVAVIGLSMIAVYLYAPIKQVSLWGISIFVLLSSILIFCFAQNDQAQAESKISKLMVWIGQRSYGMYLFHLIALGLIKVFYLPKQTLPAEKIMLFFIFFIVIFILSWAIEKYYSMPLNLKIRRTWIKAKK